MDLKKIDGNISRLAELAKGWKTDEPTDPIERDIALELLRGVYSELKFAQRAPKPEPVSCAVPTAEGVESTEAVVAEAIQEAIPEPEPISCAVPTTEPEPISCAVPTTEPEPAPIAEDIHVVPRRVDPDVIRSLYGESNPTVVHHEPEAEQIKESEATQKAETVGRPAKETSQSIPATTLGDTINSGRQTLGQTLQNGKQDMASRIAASEHPDLRKSIGLNDKFLMIRDMFDGDTEAFNSAIVQLDRFTDLDDAIIYIHDTYNWSADSEGVKLLVELLERKLG